MPTPSTIEAFVKSTVMELLDGAAAALEAAAQSPDTHNVHRLRVSIRRFQQAMRVFEPYFQPAGLKRIRGELKRVMTAAGEHRNYDVAFKLLKTSAQDLPKLGRSQSAAEETLKNELRLLAKGEPASSWPQELGLVSSPNPGDGKIRWKSELDLDENLRRLLPRMARKYFTQARETLRPGTKWKKTHQFRLKTKRFRYTLELFRSRYGPALEKRVEDLRHIQTSLGSANDDITVAEILQQVKGTDDIQARLEKQAKAKIRKLRSWWRAELDSERAEAGWIAYLG